MTRGHRSAHAAECSTQPLFCTIQAAVESPHLSWYSGLMHRSSPALLFATLSALACSPPTPTPTPTPVAVAPPAPAIPVVRPTTTITILVDAPGRASLAVEREITVPLEQALAGVPGVAQLRSVSRSDAATLVLTLEPDATSESVRVAVHERLSAARASLPPDTLPVIAAELAPRDQALTFVLTGDQPATRLRAAARSLRDDLYAQPGVAAIDLCGGREPQLQIVLDPARLAAHGVTVDAILRSLRPDSPLAPGLQARISPRSIDDLAALVIKSGASPVTLRDLGRITLDTAAPTCDALRLDGGAVVIGTIVARRDVAAADFAAALQARLAALRSTLPTGLQLTMPTMDRVALELNPSTAPGETLALTAPSLAAALASTASPLAGPTALIQSSSAAAPLALELLLERGTGPGQPALEQTLAAIPGLRVRAIDGDLDALTRVSVVGDDLETAARVAGELADIARTLPGVSDASPRWALAPELVLEPQRERLAALGIAEAELRTTLAVALAGATLPSIAIDGATVPVRVQLGESLPADLSARAAALATLEIPTSAGPVRLSDIVALRTDTQPQAITRLDRRRAVEVELRLREPAAASSAALQAAVAADLRLPPGHVVRFE